MAATTGVKQLSELRDRLELMLSIPAGNAYVDSTPELDDINQGYQDTAYKYDWPSLLQRGGIVVAANKNRYDLPTNFRKFRYLFVQGAEHKEVEYDKLRFSSYAFGVDQNAGLVAVSTLPTTASTAYTTSNSETAGNSVVVELDTVTGLAAGDEVFINGTTPEFTYIESVNTTTPSITISFENNITAGNIIYKRDEIIDYQMYRNVTLLSASSDTTLLPPALDYIMLHKSAAYAYERLEMFDEAKRQNELWELRTAEVFYSHDKNSTGQVTQFSVD